MQLRKVVFLSLLLAGFVMASGRTVTGTTGYIVMPTGEGLRAREYNLGLNAFSGTSELKSNWKLYGGLGTSDGSEISVVGRSEREGLFLNMKWFGSLNNYEDPLLVGMGFENLSSLGTFGDYPNMYMVTTKKFLNGNSFSIGATGRYIGREIIASMLFGFEIYSSESMSWVSDLVSYQDNKYNVNAGLRVYNNSNTYFSFNVLNVVKMDNQPGYNETVGTIGVTMTNFM